MPIRTAIFWIHLAAGLAAGVVIFIMSVTGIAIAFEEEILAWRDHEVKYIATSDAGGAPLAMAELVRRVEAEHAGKKVASMGIFREPARAWEAYLDDGTLLYVNALTGAAEASRAEHIHEVFHKLEEWHRWLGARDGLTSTGRVVTGVCNLALVVLCATGLYLWFPRKWNWRSLRPLLVLKRSSTGKARDFNWHAVFGFWSLPVLLLLSVTAVVISFEWGHRLVFTLAGEEAPKSRNYGMMAVPPPVMPEPGPGAARLPFEQVVAKVAQAFPDWQSITFEDLLQEPDAAAPAPLEIGVTVPGLMPSRAYIPVKSDPYTGDVLQAVHFEDRSLGLQARVWMRFLHTGGAFGLPGKIIACLATTACLLLVWTGFSLTVRRYGAWRRRTAAAA